jgi:hypothetical protein
MLRNFVFKLIIKFKTPNIFAKKNGKKQKFSKNENVKKRAFSLLGRQNDSFNRI